LATRDGRIFFGIVNRVTRPRMHPSRAAGNMQAIG